MDRLDFDETRQLDQSVGELIRIERAIMASPADTVRSMAMKIIVATREEGTCLGDNMTALVAEARLVLNS